MKNTATGIVYENARNSITPVMTIPVGEFDGLLDGMQDGTGVRITVLSGVVNVNLKLGTVTFPDVVYTDGEAILEGKMTYKSWNYVILTLLRNAASKEEREDIKSKYMKLPGWDGWTDSEIEIIIKEMEVDEDIENMGERTQAELAEPLASDNEFVRGAAKERLEELEE